MKQKNILFSYLQIFAALLVACLAVSAYGQFYNQWQQPYPYQAVNLQQPGVDPAQQAKLAGQATNLLKQLLQRAGELIDYIPDNAAQAPLPAAVPAAYAAY